MGDEPLFEVYAIRYAHRDTMTRAEHFYHGDPQGARRMPLDYFVWVARSDDVVVLIDAGFTADTARRRAGDRMYLQSPPDTLAHLGISADRVSHLVLTHFHFDHTGHVASFPNARVYAQRAEYDFWAGKDATRGVFLQAHEPSDIAYLSMLLESGRLSLLDGDRQIVPGVSVHRVGGHTPGMQVVRISTAVGPVVLASDASHFYENLESDRPHSIVDNLPSMYHAFDRLRELTDCENLIVPGHDPLVMEKFPAVSAQLGSLVVRIA